MTLIAEVFPKLRSPKNKDRSMSKKSRFKGTFGKQHVNAPKNWLKFHGSTNTIFLITVNAIDLQKVYVRDMQNLETVS